MTEGERAGRWAMVYLYMVLFALWFTIASLVWSHGKELLTRPCRTPSAHAGNTPTGEAMNETELTIELEQVKAANGITGEKK